MFVVIYNSTFVFELDNQQVDLFTSTILRWAGLKFCLWLNFALAQVHVASTLVTGFKIMVGTFCASAMNFHVDELNYELQAGANFLLG